MNTLTLKRWLKSAASNWLERKGYRISKIKRFEEGAGPSAFDVQSQVAAATANRLVIFDVGANRGQTIARYRRLFPSASIHAFEPVREFYDQCAATCRADTNVFVNNFAVGDTDGEAMFHETVGGQTSSILAATDQVSYYFSEGDFNDYRTYPVRKRSLDSYCNEVGVESIDILKLDTEGYELAVLRGAETLLRSGRVGMVYTEVNFDRFWNDCALYHHIATYLEGYGVDLFGIYELGTGALGAARSGDALFMRTELKSWLLARAVEEHGRSPR